MKIYFGFTVAGERSGLEAARRIVHLLEKLGHQVLTRHLVDDDAWETDRRISAREVYQRDMAWLQECDIFVAEVSGSSFGLGFEAGYILGSTPKRVVLLYRQDLEEKLSLLIRGNSHVNCTLVPYKSAQEVDAFIPGILRNTE
jgi:2'-deoxynucleoside 5'-phosphate N-hydrolase